MDRPHIMNIGNLAVSRADTIDGVDYRLYNPQTCHHNNHTDIIYTDNLYVFLEKTVKLIGEKYRSELEWWLYL